MLPLAWNEHPNLAIQLVNRFPSRKIKHELRTMLLNQPHKAMDDLDSLELILGSELSPDVTCDQLKVSGKLHISFSPVFVFAKSIAVPSVLGPRQSYIRNDVFPAAVQEPSFHHTIWHACTGQPLC